MDTEEKVAEDISDGFGAVTPSLEDINYSLSSEVEEEREDNSESEMLAALKTHGGWEVLEDYIKGRIEELRDIDTAGLEIELVGYKYMLSKALRDELRTLINIVDANYDQFKDEKSKK